MWIADMIRGIITVWNGVMQSVAALLTVHPAQWAEGAPWAMAASIHRDLMGIALGLMVLFWAASFFRYVDDLHKIDFREMAGWILRFAVIYAAMEFSMGLMEMILGVAVEVNESILAYAAQIAPEDVPEDVMAAVDAINLGGMGAIWQQIGAFFEALPLSLLFLILLIVVVVCGVVLIVTVYMRFMKMYVYTAIAPLPLATFAAKNLDTTGKHFLKSWAAVCLEVCVISIAFAIFNASIASNDALFTFTDTEGMEANAALWHGAVNWMTNLLIKLVLLVGMVKGAGRTIEKIVGA